MDASAVSIDASALSEADIGGDGQRETEASGTQV
jgi:hypothetical protein